MPAKSKNQQSAAGLPQKTNKEETNWTGLSLKEVFVEDMLGTDGYGEEIASDHPGKNRDVDADNNEWDNDVPVNPVQSGEPMAYNSLGQRMAEQIDFDEYGDTDEGMGGADEFVDPRADMDHERHGDYADAMAEMEQQEKDNIIDSMVDHLIYHHNAHGTPVSDWLPEDLIADFEYEYPISPDNEEDMTLANEAKEIAEDRLGKEANTGLQNPVQTPENQGLPQVNDLDGVPDTVAHESMYSEAVGLDRWKLLANLK